MGKINVLPKEVAELIAAGEVIERPASIVKELLENSIDAGATAVTVELRQGGVGYLRVTDNGSGIQKEDIPLAFLRHATSKIRLSDDLNFIATLGFRGEALASVAAVSRLELTSKTPDAALGARIRLEGGEQVDFEDAGCPDGTTIVVRDLFYNVPARLKFLRKDVTEANAVASIVEKLALSHPEISFKLFVDRKTRLHTPGDGKLLSAIHAVFGGEFSSALLPVSYGMNGVSVTGYTSIPEQSRSNRSMQHFFVNERYVRSKTCYAALEDGYKNAIMTGKYPFCVLNVSLPFDAVDVNVHPAKTEVRFLNDRSVYDCVYFAVKSTISREDILKKASQTAPATTVSNLLSGFRNEDKSEQIPLSVKPPVDAPKAAPAASPAQRPAEPKQSVDNTPSQRSTTPLPGKSLVLHSPETPYQTEKQDEEPAYQYIKPENLQPAPAKTESVTFIPEPEEEEAPEAVVPAAEPEPEAPAFYARVIGELFRTYVLFESGDTFYLMDKHAAHERILFERLKRSVDLGERQMLLKPIVLSVSQEERQSAFDHAELLSKMGFSFEDFGDHTLLLREVPLALTVEGDVGDMFLDTVRRILENRREISSEGYDNLLHSIACRAAIKANDHNDLSELTELLRQVYENDEIRHCPHGRPVVIAMTRSELEKRFGRI